MHLVDGPGRRAHDHARALLCVERSRGADAGSVWCVDEAGERPRASESWRPICPLASASPPPEGAKREVCRIVV